MDYTGIVTDVRPADQPDGTYRWALNKVKNRTRASLADDMPVSIESYFTDRDAVDEAIDIGKISLPDEDTVVFSIVFRTEFTVPVQSSRISILHEDGTYTTVIEDPLLNFQEDSFVDGISIVNFDGTRSIIWTDNFNPARILNIDEPQIELGDSKCIVNADQLALLDYFITASAPNIKSVEVNDSGGALQTGVYMFAIAYQIEGDGYTNYMPVSNPVPITESKRFGGFRYYEGADAGTVTGKSVTINLERMDTRFIRFKLGIIKVIKGQTTATEVIASLINENGEATYTYTGNDIETPILLEDILVNNANYKTVRTLTFSDKKLYMGGLTTEDYAGQEEANKINVEWVFDEDIALNDTSGSFKEGDVCFAKKSFMPGEVYALFISWIKNSGGYTPAYLISGRKSGTVDLGGVTINETDRVDVVQQAAIAGNLPATHFDEDISISKDAKYFQTRETAKVTNTIIEDGEVVGGYGTMGYWENDELYPEDFPEFAGERVRHHRFPTLNTLSNCGLLHTKVEGLQSDLVQEEFSVEPILFEPVNANAGENKVEYLTQDGDLYHVESADGKFNRKVVITFKKKVAVEFDFFATVTGIRIVHSGIFGVWFRQYSKAHISFRADGHGDLITPVNTTNSIIFYHYHDYIKTSANAHRSGVLVMGTNTKMELDLGGWPYIDKIHDFKLNFKVKEWSVTDKIISGDVFTNSLGLKLSNIKVPAELEGKVTGYQIFYAKRNINNSTVYAMGQPVDLQTADPSPDSGATDFRIHPGDLMVNNSFPSIPLSYVRHEVTLETDLLEVNQKYQHLNEPYVVSRVQDYTYEPHNKAENQEAMLRYSLTTPQGQWTTGKLVTLMGYKTNLFSVYYDQTLVCTGPVFMKTRETIEKLFGGDQYINAYAFRTTTGATYGDTDKVYQHIVWSANHLGYRQEGVEYGQMYYPKHAIPGDFGVAPEGMGEKDPDNYVVVNRDYTQLNTMNQVYPDNVTRKRINKFYHRVIASTVMHVEGEASMLRRVLPGDYYEMPKDKGEIVNLQAINGELLIHTKNSLYKTISKTQLETEEVAVTIGSGSIFAVQPEELFFDEQGIAGTLHQESCGVLNGNYMFVDERVGRIFSIRESLADYANNGNRLWFREHLKFALVDQLRAAGIKDFQPDEPNSRLGVGFSLGYDSQFERYFVTKKDFRIKDITKLVQAAPTTHIAQEPTCIVAYKDGYYEFTSTVNIPSNALSVLVVYTPDIKFNIVGIDNSAANTVLRADSTEYYPELADGSTTSLVIVHESPGTEEHIYYHNGKLWDHTGRILDRNSIEIEDKSFTVSFDLQGKLVSEHSHTPGMYITTTRNLRSCSNGITYLHNSYKMPISVRSFVDIVTKFPRLVRIQSAIIDSQVFNEQGQLIPKREFDKIMVHNDTQCSGELVITGSKGRSGAMVFM